MSLTGETVIQLHNEALANDADYRAEYESEMQDLDAYLAEMEITGDRDYFRDFQIDHTGYIEMNITAEQAETDEEWLFSNYRDSLY